MLGRIATLNEQIESLKAEVELLKQQRAADARTAILQQPNPFENVSFSNSPICNAQEPRGNLSALLSSEQIHTLVAFFDVCLRRFAPIVHQGTPAELAQKSPFLLAVICTLASRSYAGTALQTSLHAALLQDAMATCSNLLMGTWTGTQTPNSCDVQALLLLSLWPPYVSALQSSEWASLT